MSKPKYITDKEQFNKERRRIVQLRDELSTTVKEYKGIISQLEESRELPEEVNEQIEELKKRSCEPRRFINSGENLRSVDREIL